MCGYCNFACCNHNTFKVWTTPEERELYKKKYNLCDLSRPPKNIIFI